MVRFRGLGFMTGNDQSVDSDVSDTNQESEEFDMEDVVAETNFRDRQKSITYTTTVSLPRDKVIRMKERYENADIGDVIRGVVQRRHTDEYDTKPEIGVKDNQITHDKHQNSIRARVIVVS